MTHHSRVKAENRTHPARNWKLRAAVAVTVILAAFALNTYLPYDGIGEKNELTSSYQVRNVYFEHGRVVDVVRAFRWE